MVEEVISVNSDRIDFENFLKSFFDGAFYRVSDRRWLDLQTGNGTIEQEGYKIMRGLLVFTGVEELARDSAYVLGFSESDPRGTFGFSSTLLEIWVNEELVLDKVRRFSEAYEKANGRTVKIVRNY